jgi:hypothetical protein
VVAVSLDSRIILLFSFFDMFWGLDEKEPLLAQLLSSLSMVVCLPVRFVI